MEFVFGNYLSLPYELITTPVPAQPGRTYINYSTTGVPGYISVFQDGLLLSESIERQHLFISREKDMPVFFQTTDDHDIRFDIFSAIFYLLARYEEYLPHDQDEHGRYRSSNSILANDAFQFQPIVETWLQYFKEVLRKTDSTLTFKKHEFEFEPTFDIDNAFAYKGRRGYKLLVSLLILKRLPILLDKQPDPFDTTTDILFYLERFQLKARFFFLMNDQGPFNSNVNPNADLLHDQIRSITRQHPFGIHPSYSAIEAGLLEKEKQQLEKIVGIPTEHGRQHFLRFRFPDYFEAILQAGIKQDHSLGYPDVSGFRAGISRPFPFYNLISNRKTDLMLHPFSFMDATYIYYKKADTDQIIKKILEIKQQVSKVNGKLVTISHNDLLGTSSQVNFWKVFENCAV